MDAPPRPLNQRLFTAVDLLHSTLRGVLVFLVVIGVFLFTFQFNKEVPERARAFSFIVLATSNLSLIFSSMSNGSFNQLGYIFKMKSNWLVVLAVTFSLIIITQINEIRSIFHFGYLKPIELIATTGISILVFFLINLWDWALRNRATHITPRM